MLYKSIVNASVNESVVGGAVLATLAGAVVDVDVDGGCGCRR